MPAEPGRLTNKQKAFAALIHNGTSQLKSYRSAYDTETTNDDSARVQANRIFRMPSVQKELKRLVEEERAASVMSKSVKKTRLIEIAERILREGTDKTGKLLPSAAATATKIYEVVARLDGDFGDVEAGSTESHLSRLRKALSRKPDNNI